ncbi:hypothetical protein, partial [Mycobacterium kansasii]|uniref:hypothetical protein n=2 Tax=Mycobacterium kansasii TaxID=1768 RepID=UPI001561635E
GQQPIRQRQLAHDLLGAMPLPCCHDLVEPSCPQCGLQDSHKPWTNRSGSGQRQAGQFKRNEASDLHNARSQLGVNQGRTAEDLLGRYWRGEQRLTTIASQCEVKSAQSDLVADAVNHLRDQLSEIARSGNDEIERILSDKGSIEAKVAAVNRVIEQSNARASCAGDIATSHIVDAMQKVLSATTGQDAREWLRDHDVNLDGPRPTRPLSVEDLKNSLASKSSETSAFGGDRPAPDMPAQGEAMPPPTPAFGHDRPTPEQLPLLQDRTPMPQTMLAFGGDRPEAGAPAMSNVFPTPLPGAPAIGSPSVPGVSAPASPAAATAPLSPQSLSQSFTTGMMTGAPAAAGTQSLSEGALHAATQPLSPATPPTAPPMAGTPTIPASTPVVPHVPDAGAAAASPAPVLSAPADTTMTSVAQC